MADNKYVLSLTGAQVDDALTQLNQRTAEGWAVGQRDGVDVASTSQFYHNNAKYYAQEAQDIVSGAAEDAAAAAGSALEAYGHATAASGSASAASADAVLAQSWTVGGTGTRAGEDTNNAKYWADAASAIAGGGVQSFNGRGGIVAPQTGDYTAAMVGALPDTTTIPSKTSQLTNDSGFITASSNITGTAAGLSATLSAASGGTGQTSLQATRNAMGLGNTTGALPVANGGTGTTTLTSGYALIGAGTGNVTTRAITNNTTSTAAVTASTNLVTMNTLKNALNRETAVASADPNYTTYMARGISLATAEPNSIANGQICLIYG